MSDAACWRHNYDLKVTFIQTNFHITYKGLYTHVLYHILNIRNIICITQTLWMATYRTLILYLAVTSQGHSRT